MKYEQYLPLLREQGYLFTISSFQSRRFWEIIYKPGRTTEKIFWTFVGYLRRTLDLLRAPFYEGVFVNLWVTPVGLPVFERMLFVFNRRVIYDIDDMIFITRHNHMRQTFFQKLKGKRKPNILMKYSSFVIGCTPKLEEIARNLNQYRRAIDISSTFDTKRFIPVSRYEQSEVTTVGWTGTHSTIPFLETIQPALAEVSRRRRIRLLVIANREYRMPGVDTDFLPWSEASEVSDLHRFQIGVYPIPANEWSLGKSSLKALTYMAIGIPFVATAYGTNFRVMNDGVEGFLAASDEEWVDRLVRLIDDVELRKRMGRAGRERVQREFSVEANFPKYMQV
ncbi:MAG TPA: glycosyltransferase, partial [Chitinophagaceae bacterium]|nr:glycosyltransferase [Chitinophagaceae bacterium]